MNLMPEKDPYFRLTYSLDLVLCIADFIGCIGRHKSDLKSARNIGFMAFAKEEKLDLNPGGILTDYIYLEACSFFENVRELKNKGESNIPNLPDYLPPLKKFRNNMVGHRDIGKKYKSYSDWGIAHEKIQKLIPVEQLIKDMKSSIL